MDTEDVKVKSLAKAINILNCFSSSKTELGITEISNMLGLNKSNVHNIVSTFVQLGYMQPCPNGKYTLGLKLLEHAFVINRHLGYQSAVYDLLFNLSNEVDELARFGIPWKMDVLYLYVIQPLSRIQTMQYRNTTGLAAPIYSTGIGRAILSAFPRIFASLLWKSGKWEKL